MGILGEDTELPGARHRLGPVSDVLLSAKQTTSDADRKAATEKRDAAYAVAKEKCDALAAAAQATCIQEAKARHGQS